MLFNADLRSIPVPKVKAVPLAGLLYFLLLLVNYRTLQTGLGSNLSVLLGAALLFVYASRPASPRMYYGVSVLVLLLFFCSWQLFTRSTLSLALVLTGILLFYLHTGRFSAGAFLLFIFCTSVSDKLIMEFSVEIKQELCTWAYLSLKDVLSIEKQEGVHLWISGRRISVDTACMGLSMLRTGFLCAVALLSLEEKRSGRRFSYMQYLLVFALALFCIILSNYCRILILLLTGNTEENLLHQLIGLSCFALYILLPLFLLFRFMKPRTPYREVRPGSSYIPVFIFGILMIIAGALSLRMEKGPEYSRILEGLSTAGGEWINPEVYKIQQEGKLIYIKTASHSPMLCWTGSGYHVLRDYISTYEHKPAHCTLLEKDGKVLYSYWWYENGSERALSFPEVMLTQLFTGSPARLINVTLEEETGLLTSAQIQ
ncbi:MAG: exosortase N [Bacteroidia bacterium]|nr:exosortase N [Bacteroidia bacterium]